MKHFAHALLAIAVAGVATASAYAQTSPSPSPEPTPVATPSNPNAWHLDLAPYIWAPNINGKFAFQALSDTIETHIGPSGYLSHLNTAGELAASAHNHAMSLAMDVIYMNLSTSDASVKTVTGPNGAVQVPVNVSTSVHFRGTVWTIVAGKPLTQSETSPAEVIAGVRGMGSRALLDWNFAVPVLALSRSGSTDQSLHVWDFVAGARGKLGLGSHWYVPYYIDYGSGSRNNTFQAVVGIANSHNWGDIVLVNRWLQFYFNSAQGTQNMQMVGPALAVRFNL